MLDIEQGIKALTALPGIGSWTASYIAMRAWSWPDVFLAGDYLIKQRFPGMTPRQIERYAERWRPWRLRHVAPVAQRRLGAGREE